MRIVCCLGCRFWMRDLCVLVHHVLVCCCVLFALTCLFLLDVSNVVFVCVDVVLLVCLCVVYYVLFVVCTCLINVCVVVGCVMFIVGL